MCGKWSTPLHATQVAKRISHFVSLQGAKHHPIASVAKKEHRACGTDGKCAIPACWPQAA